MFSFHILFLFNLWWSGYHEISYQTSWMLHVALERHVPRPWFCTLELSLKFCGFYNSRPSLCRFFNWRTENLYLLLFFIDYICINYIYKQNIYYMFLVMHLVARLRAWFEDSCVQVALGNKTKHVKALNPLLSGKKKSIGQNSRSIRHHVLVPGLLFPEYANVSPLVVSL